MTSVDGIDEVGAVRSVSVPRFHGRNLRKGRHSEPGRVYLVTAVTIGRMPLFDDLTHGRAVVAALRAIDAKGMAQTLAYVVMPDHLHWLLALGDGATLGRVVGLAKGRSARSVNRLRQARDEPAITPLWQAGYHDHAVRQDEDVRELARYVIANPIRAGLVKQVGEYALWDAAWL